LIGAESVDPHKLLRAAIPGGRLLTLPPLDWLTPPLHAATHANGTCLALSALPKSASGAHVVVPAARHVPW